MRKTENELQLLRTANQIAEAALYTIEHTMKPGMRECEVWAKANKTMISLGAERLHGILTTGGRTNAYYRYEGANKIMQSGDLLVTDVVLQYMGYYTCVSRAFLIGNEPTKEQKKICTDAYNAMNKAIDTVRARVMTDKIAQALPKRNWANYSSNIGHGLGLHIQEAPFIADIYSKECSNRTEGRPVPGDRDV